MRRYLFLFTRLMNKDTIDVPDVGTFSATANLVLSSILYKECIRKKQLVILHHQCGIKIMIAMDPGFTINYGTF
jgi:hypothetical protein